MICKNCGANIDENAIFCPYCGTRTNGDSTHNSYGFDPYSRPGFFTTDTKESWPVAIVSFCMWQIGLVLWLVWRRTRPGKAKSAVKGTLSATCFQFPIAGLILWLLWRHDYENKEFAKIGAISAIVGASLTLVLGALLILLSHSGNLVLPDISQLMQADPNAIFVFLKSLF